MREVYKCIICGKEYDTGIFNCICGGECWSEPKADETENILDYIAEELMP